MKEFESALAAAFGVGAADVPALAIDRLDGRAGTGAGPVPICYTWSADPVRPSVSPCRAAEPVPMSYCRAEHTEPVRPSVCRAEVPVAAAAG
jgi:hypothetical protein